MVARCLPLMTPAAFLIATATVGAENAGTLSFRRHVVNAQSQFQACAVFDVDRDGKLDIVAGGFWYRAPDWKPTVVRNVEVIRGRFDDYSNLPLDVNGDGWTDLVSANYRSSKLSWIEHPGAKLGQWKEHIIDVPGPMETGRLIDVDADGRLDVLPNGASFAAWWEVEPIRRPDTKSAAWRRHELPKELAGHGIGFGDIDGDGRGDVVGPFGWAAAPTDRRRGRWTWHPDLPLHRDASIPILVFDVDRDGDNDIVWGRGHNIGLYWTEQSPSGTESGRIVWKKHAIDSSISQCHALIAADFDHDGSLEVMAGKRFLGHDGRDPGEYDPMAIHLYCFDPRSRSWGRTIVSNDGLAAFGLDPKSVDLDADGDLDLVCADRIGLFWFENLGQKVGSRQVRSQTPLYSNHAQLLVVQDALGTQRPVANAHDWAQRRSHVLAHMQSVMGTLPDPSRRVPLAITIHEEERNADYVRKKLSFVAEPGDRIPAYLLIPNNRSGSAPAMLCLHQTVAIGKAEPAGLGNRDTLDYAHELAQRGYVCLAPDYPSFGDYAFDFAKVRDRYPSGSMKAIWNNLRAVDLLESLPEVAPDRIGCIGHSLGGHNALFTAVFDQRIRVVVSSCGFTALHHYYGGKLQGWTSDRYMPRIRDVYHNDPDKVPFDFHEIVAALAPRPVFVNAPLHDSNFDVAGVRKVIDQATTVYELLGGKDLLVAAYPDSAHDFPDPVRRQCYEWLDKRLK